MSANVSILGNIGRAPETRTTPEGILITSFSLASNTVRQTPQGPAKKTDWYRVTALGKQAETLAKYTKKGFRLFIHGKLTFNPWIDREGAPQVSADVLLTDFQFVDSVGENSNSSAPINSANSGAAETDFGALSGVEEIADQTFSY